MIIKIDIISPCTLVYVLISMALKRDTVLTLDRCIYVLKDMIEYFEGRSTSVFVYFLYTSKAYDKLTIGNCLTSYYTYKYLFLL